MAYDGLLLHTVLQLKIIVILKLLLFEILSSLQNPVCVGIQNLEKEFNLSQHQQ